MAILNFQTNWEGHSGQEVQDFINTYLQNHETVLTSLNNNAVTSISAGYKTDPETGEEDKTVIVIKGLNAAGLVVTTDEFSTVTQASFSQHFNSDLDKDYNPPTIIGYGDNLEIPYDYYVTDQSEQRIRNYTARVTFIISNKGNKKTYVTSTYASTASSTLKPGVFTIPAEYLGVGTNTISMSAITVSGTTQTTVFSMNYSTYVADLSLTCSLSGESFYTPRAYDANFTLNFSVKDSKGGNIPSEYQIKKRIYINRIGNSYLATAANELLGSSIQSNYHTLVRSASAYSSTDVSQLGEIRFLVQAYITTDDGEIVSNTVLLQMLNSTGIANNPSTLYIATQLSKVTMSSSTIRTSSLQYDSVAYNFYLYCATASSYNITIDQNVKASGNVSANSLTAVNYSYTYRIPGNSILTIGEFSVTNEVIALTTALAEPTGATLNLLASEKAVGAEDDSWTDGTTVCSFNGFDWVSNGWVRTPEGTALLVNNGASVDIDYKLCDRNNYVTANYPFTISFKYKITNGTNELEELIKCLSSNTGILIRPQYVGLSTSSTISQQISNDEVHEVTFVYYGNDESSGIYKNLQAIYIDGKVQAISPAGVFVSHTDKISVAASTASLYLYSVKAFRKALSFTEIQALYCFNQSDSSEIASYITRNNIFSEATTTIGDYGQSVDREKLPDGAAILVLYGTETNPTPWLTVNSYIKDADGVNKGYKHALSAMRLYIKGDEANSRNFYAVGGCISAQGTSSMGYPIKNFRIYTNKAESNGSGLGKVTAFYQGDNENPLPWNFLPDNYDSTSLANWTQGKKEYQMFSTEYGDSYTSAPANRFCLKADYAESSGVHNTGFARLSNYLLKNSATLLATDITSSNESTLIPQQQAVSGNNPSWKYDVRANIDGRPIYLFFVSPEYTDSLGNVVESKEYYGGRYNMNNDKSNVQVFGFEKVSDYFDNPIVAAEGKVLQNLALQSGIDPYYAETHNADPEDTFINPIECWEFSSNDGIARQMGAFYHSSATAFTAKTGNVDPVDSSIDGLSWINSTWEYRYPDLEDTQADLYYRSGESKPYLLYKTYQFLYENNYALHPNNTALNNFADNLHLYFNVNNIVKYFVLTHWFIAVDQRIKNCMLSFYCDPYGVSAEEAEASPLHYMRGYYIFYDNDTILGLDNAGAIRQPWDFYETDTGNESSNASNYSAFPGNGIHGLWTNLQKCYELYRDNANTTSSAYALGRLVAEAYRVLRNTATDSVISSYLEEAQCGYYPEAIQNVDLEIKYLNPNQLRTQDSIEPTPAHLDMAQGTREFHRKNLLKKRTTWLDDIYHSVQADSYNIAYKTGAQPGTDHGTIRFTSDPTFRFWRFYAATGSFSKATGMLTSTDTGAITISGSGTESLTMSDAFMISDLYGCKTLDFSDFEFDASGMSQPTVSGVFPYLQEFTLHPLTGSNVKASEIPWLNPENMPNLRTIQFCNIKPKEGSYFGVLNLISGTTEFSKLETLDFRGTPISKVVLPTSSTLRTLSLEAPVELSIINKPNISAINVGTINLNTLVVSGCSSTVYTWALAAANSLYGNNAKEITITFGNSAEAPYTIDANNSAQLTALDSLARKVIAGGTTLLSITGNIYTAESYESEYIEQAFPNLNITNQLVTDGFALEWTSDLYEDEFTATEENFEALSCLVIKANMNVASWAITVDGDPSYTMNNHIKIVKSTRQRCWIHADPYAQNLKYDNKDHKLVVIATLDNGEVYNSYDLTGNEITIYYVPITQITLSTEDLYVSDAASEVSINFGTHTKKHMITRAAVEGASPSFVANLTNDASYTWVYDDNGILSGLRVFLSTGKDTTATVSVYGVTNTINIYYNSNLVEDLDNIGTDSPLYWLKALRAVAGGQFDIGRTISKKQASQIPLNDSHTYWSGILSNLASADVTVPQDFDNLQYFLLGGGTDGVFTIPGIAFTNLSTPANTTAVVWTTITVDTASYAVITFGSSVRKMAVALTFDSVPQNLVFDLSKTKITSIGAYGTNLANINNYTASIQLTAIVGTFTSMRSTSLFVYPTTIEQIGNTDKSVSSLISASAPTLMFNLSNRETLVNMSSATAYYPIYSLKGFTSNVKIGAIISYRSKGSAFETEWAKITETYQAFVFNNNAYINNSVFALPSVRALGDHTLYRDDSYYSENLEQAIDQVSLNSGVVTIGDSVFNRGNYRVVNASDPSADRAVFNSVISIGANAFYMMTRSQTLQFGGNLKSVGSACFTNNNPGVEIKIYLNKTDALTSVQSNSFGGNDSNVTIYVPADSDLYTQLTADGMGCKNHVQTFNFA